MTPNSYKQTDARWANKLVGFGSGKYQTFYYVGCVVCCITYLYNLVTGRDLNPSQVNDLLKSAGAFSGAAVYWSRVPFALPELKWYWRDYNYNWALDAKVKYWITVNPKVPVLIEVVEPSSVTKKHWILALGGGKMYNSITGLIQPTSTYKDWTGAARFSRS